eukprot:1418224-Rhodomonas_salina.1
MFATCCKIRQKREEYALYTSDGYAGYAGYVPGKWQWHTETRLRCALRARTQTHTPLDTRYIREAQMP